MNLRKLSLLLPAMLLATILAAAGAERRDAPPPREATTRMDPRKDPVVALKKAQQDLLIAEGTRDVQLVVHALRTLGAAQKQLGLHMDFLQTTLRARDLLKDAGDAARMAAILGDLSNAYAGMEMMDQSIEEARTAVVFRTRLNDPAALATAQGQLTTLLMKAGRHAEGMSIASQMQATCSSVGDPRCLASAHHKVAQLLLDQRKYGDALPFLTKAANVLSTTGDPTTRCALLLDQATAMLGLHMIDPARKALEELKVLTTLSRDPDHRLTALRLRYELALAAKEWQNALLLLQGYTAQSDSIRSARADKNLAGLLVMHQLDRKEKDNAQLRDLTAKQQLTIADQRLDNRFLLIALALGSLLVVALFITSRHSLRMTRRLKLKNMVIHRKNEEIQSKVMELKRQNLRLTESMLSEEGKDLILKEIHHRVKNNLQVVDSMLSLQVSGSADPSLQNMLRDARGRIHSMAMVHEHIYRTPGNGPDALRTHLERLSRSVLVAHGAHDRVSVTVSSQLPNFPIETQLPLSLVVNELVTNSIKHAFVGRDAGAIKIVVDPASDGYELRFSDNGMGMEALDDPTQGSSFGRELIHILCHQLNGTICMGGGKGNVLIMQFMPDKELLRKAG
jgi:two-component sensor histidine kinase